MKPTPRLEDLEDGFLRMKIGVAIERLVPAAKAMRDLDPAERRARLVNLLRTSGLSDDEMMIAGNYLRRRHHMAFFEPEDV